MKNFIDFIVDAAKDSALADELHNLVSSSDHKGVSSWLQSKGYDVQEEDCKKLIDNKDEINSTKLGFMY